MVSAHGASSLAQIVQRLMHFDSWPFLAYASGPQAKTEDLGLLESECFAMQPPASWPAPRSFGRHRVVLHAFSGRRRICDFQYYFDQLTETLQDAFVIHVVSLDTTVDKINGNIADPAVRKFWFRGIAQGRIIGLLAGPPCETWSRARAVQCSDTSRRDPRVVRTGDDLWGLAQLCSSEIEQVCVGNLLLCFTLEAFVWLNTLWNQMSQTWPPFGDCLLCLLFVLFPELIFGP